MRIIQRFRPKASAGEQPSPKEAKRRTKIEDAWRDMGGVPCGPTRKEVARRERARSMVPAAFQSFPGVEDL